MVHITPLFTGQRRPRDAAPDAAPAGLVDPYWQEVAAHYERRMARQQAFDTEIAARRLDGEIASAEAEVAANAPADGEGLHHAMYGEVDPHTGRVVLKGRFDTLFDNFLKQAPPELRAGLASRKPALREAGSVRMAMQQNQRRAQYEQDQLAAAQAEELDAIAKSDPDDTAAFDAARHAGLDLIAKMNLDPDSRLQAEAAWRDRTVTARIEALIARDPGRATEMLSAAPVAGGRQAGEPGTDPRADLSPYGIRQLLREARAATINRLIEARANIYLASQNAPDAIASTGSYSGAMPGAADFAAVYGVEEGGKRYQEFGQKIDAGRQAFGMRTMPNHAIQALLSNTASGTTNSQQEVQTSHDLLAEPAKQNLRARAADPGAYVRQAFPTVDAAWNNVSDSKGYQNAILWSVSAQRQLGIEDVQPLPNSIAEDAVVSSIGNKSQREATRALSRSLLGDTVDPNLRMSLIKQLIYVSVMMSL